jgi:hypothetical protein
MLAIEMRQGGHKGTVDEDQANRVEVGKRARWSTAAAPARAGANASFSSARRSVYFHSSTRRCGRPRAAKMPIARRRASRTAALPGSAPATASKLPVKACSALVRVTAIVMSCTYPSSRKLRAQPEAIRDLAQRVEPVQLAEVPDSLAFGSASGMTWWCV